MKYVVREESSGERGYDDDDDDGFSGYLLSCFYLGELELAEGLQLPAILANTNDLN